MGEVDSMRRVVDAMCAGIGRKVALVADYDRFRIDEALNDAYFAMVVELHARHHSQATRYAASAFIRAKPCRRGRRLLRCLRAAGRLWRFLGGAWEMGEQA